MDIIKTLINNHILICGCSCWIIAQIIKTIIYLIVNKQLRIERLVGDGGMPSCHSATVAGLATAVAFSEGVGSTAFAITFFFAIIVMHDAMGVRQETGKQARVINDIVTEISERGMSIMSMPPDERLKEFVGHTGFQVCVGAIIGVMVAIIEYMLIFK